MRQEPDGFAEFWAVWRPNARHTDGRGLARDTYAKHLKNGAEPQDIIDGAKWFFFTMKDRDRDYVPLAATWINRGAYEDLAEQFRTYEARKAQRLKPQSANVVDIEPRRSPEERAEMVARSRELFKVQTA